MLWKGIAIGGVLGGIVGRGIWGAIFGAVVGYQIHQRIEFGRRRSPGSRCGASHWREPDPLASAYAVLGARRSDSDQELVRRYRELAKRHHPDAMRARGASEEAIARATERMSRINAAWAEIRAARSAAGADMAK